MERLDTGEGRLYSSGTDDKFPDAVVTDRTEFKCEVLVDFLQDVKESIENSVPIPLEMKEVVLIFFKPLPECLFWGFVGGKGHGKRGWCG